MTFHKKLATEYDRQLKESYEGLLFECAYNCVCCSFLRGFAGIAGVAACDKEGKDSDQNTGQTEDQTDSGSGSSGLAGSNILVAEHKGEEASACGKEQSEDVEDNTINRNTAGSIFIIS